MRLVSLVVLIGCLSELPFTKDGRCAASKIEGIKFRKTFAIEQDFPLYGLQP